MRLFWTFGNNNYYGNSWEHHYGREAAGFFEGKIMFFLTIGNHNYGREAAAFLYEASNGNNNYGREAAAFLNLSNCNK